MWSNQRTDANKWWLRETTSTTNILWYCELFYWAGHFFLYGLSEFKLLADKQLLICPGLLFWKVDKQKESVTADDVE